jgi:large subunit ribosomal protein L10
VIREDKAKLVAQMQAQFRDAPHAVLAGYSGLTVNSANELRRKIDQIGGRYTVIKNRLARRAAAGTAVEKLADQFRGPCALVTHQSDPIALAKTMTDFVKDHPAIELRAAVVDGSSVVDAKGVQQLAKLPGLLELRAQLLALINTPATTLVRLLGTPGSQLARVVDARREALGGGAAPGETADEGAG